MNCVQSKKNQTPIEFTELLPENEAAETAIIEACLFDNNSVGKALGIISPEDFYGPGRREIFAAMVQFHREDRAFNIVSIVEAFRNHPRFESLQKFFDDLLPFTAQTVGHNSRIVKEFSDRRKLISATYKANRNLFDISQSLDDAVRELQTVSGEIFSGSI